MSKEKVFISIIVWSSYLAGCYNILYVVDYVWGVGFFIFLFVILLIVNKSNSYG